MFGSIRYEEPFFRPPAEAGSVLLQLTVGCSHNRCTYCAMYRQKQYRIRPKAELIRECERLGDYLSRTGAVPRKAFLGDGDALAAPMEDLVSVLNAIKTFLPSIRRVGTYVTAANVIEKSAAELSELADLGLKIAYLGMESGADDVLKLIVKGNSAANMLSAAAKLDQAKWQLSLIVMLGIGGRGLSQKHAEETARVVSEIAPNFLSFLVTVVIPGTPFDRAVKKGLIEVLSCRELLKEAHDILAGLKIEKRNVIFRANHVSNFLPLEGRLPRDQGTLTAVLEDWIAECPPELYPDNDPAFL